MSNIDPLHAKVGADLTPKDPELLKAKNLRTEFIQQFFGTNGIHGVGDIVKAKDGTYELRVYGHSREGLNNIGEDYKGLKLKKKLENRPVLL